MSYTVELTDNMGTPTIAVVGCGGTGGFVAEGLCRLLARNDHKIILIDHDRVKPHNLRRQNFYESDIGKFKSQALGERLARQFQRPIGYSVYPYNRDLLNTRGGSWTSLNRAIILGCVDNAEARRSIASRMEYADWWIDAGNGYQSGQVLLGNTNSVKGLRESFSQQHHTVDRLPLPSLQLPALLIPKAAPKQDCAEAIIEEDQSPVINQTIAALMLDILHRLLKGELTWMGAYIDMEEGILKTVPAEPETLAQMFHVSEEYLLEIPSCGRGCMPTPERIRRDVDELEDEI